MIEIEKIKSKKVKTKYGELKPGDVFNFGEDFKAIGIKTSPGHVLAESMYGTYTFDQVSSLHKNVSIIFQGRLIKLGVTDKCNHSD